MGGFIYIFIPTVGLAADGAGVLDKRTDVKLNSRNQVLSPKEVNREVSNPGG